MASVFISKSGEFFRRNETFKEILMGHMSMDIEVAIKTSAGTPVKTGGMKSEVRHFKASNGKWRVEADKAYSAVQEAGVRLSGKGAPTKPFSHYTTPGTSSGWFRRAIDSVMRHRDEYVSEAKKAAGF